ncbi:MAG: hypothetical protein V4688_02960 [Pseudomonadota bacterium]
MMTPRLLHRVREFLDTFMAEIRPSPTERQRQDYSYRLTEDAFVLQYHNLAGESQLLTAHALLKVVHSEDPEGWLLYVPNAEGHWQPHADLVFSPELIAVLQAAKARIDSQITINEVVTPLQMAG